MKLLKMAPALLLGTVLLTGCGQEESVKLESAADQASYGVGLNIGRQLSREPFEMNAEAVIAGIRDAIGNVEPKLNEEAIQAAFQKITEEQERKQQALNDAAAKAGQDFLAENAKREGVKTTESGLQYEVITAVAEGATPAATDQVRVHYHGTLIDGTVFDSSVERGEPAQFPVNRVIRGWVEALQMMKVGEKWKLFIPADLAYGAQSPSPKIPANSALIFEVELLEIVGQDKE
ncbi:MULTISPECIES: FKBP-type peptidyl-prolyl cis-trans isomerase [Thalassolituus]|jgi:FKBP-type peptidyl-prolyl cis-trans isomerase FklB|uniref:Peptidyl-prolyl cis-trans isomerase n=3 Tax=root TaxID=1 RepID=M5DSQ3_9GAMM|nr:FKBP-type peptidyl-prolyl cis-trans isomerase [Thalassolituus oleivorans]PHQ85510.1 MAG: peptidylprolyl isomerase [Thalassobium sp.]MBQ0728072.1 FKBP-type peptidyl-prolyl cis-trans isomerase [Thalassolituus oleivorans]MBQ0779299.1 FKBP-type peptidyl-prolyl cis-trans isomerase [Thalassolituus oleivorans]MDF1640620.1 FKBP-type peptidyl-prolyl cis-trans isomerase [Thalassolituus oleivorans]CCU72528.1 peptidyl-prolyl cis-trans isomerase, FKBP-type [Thalassolituus oleivorans MIL-1]|tara:strand:- start:415 stop:1116 length:702 start_codon:yes stop_codon:yes gene_type:complete